MGTVKGKLEIDI